MTTSEIRAAYEPIIDEIVSEFRIENFCEKYGEKEYSGYIASTGYGNRYDANLHTMAPTADVAMEILAKNISDDFRNCLKTALKEASNGNVRPASDCHEQGFAGCD
jgi:hypothetical protein